MSVAEEREQVLSILTALPDNPEDALTALCSAYVNYCLLMHMPEKVAVSAVRAGYKSFRLLIKQFHTERGN